MNSALAKEQAAREADQLSIDLGILRGKRQRWQRMRHLDPDALEGLLAEVAIWTAPWTGSAVATQRSARITGAEWSR